MDRNDSHYHLSQHASSVAEKPTLDNKWAGCRITPYTSYAVGGFEHIRILAPSATWSSLGSRNDVGTFDKQHFSTNEMDSSKDHNQADPDINTGVCVGKRNTPAAE
jgi:hypothetical protein